MKLAIYGDSFATDINGWPSILAAKLEAEVTSFALQSSGIAFSYLNFIHTHHNFDKVIFIYADNSRQSLVSYDEDSEQFTHHLAYRPSLSVKEHLDYIQYKVDHLKNENNIGYRNHDTDFIKNSKTLTQLESLYKNYPNNQALAHLAMRDSIKLRRPDVIELEITEMINIRIREAEHFFGKWDHRLQDDLSMRPNHLTHTQNKEFAELLYRKITEGFDLSYALKKENITDFFTFEQTFEESGLTLNRRER